MSKNHEKALSRTEKINRAEYPISNYERVIARIKSDGIGYVE